MENLFSIIDKAKIGLQVEKAKVEIYSTNIANVHNSEYLPKEVNFGKLLNLIESTQNKDASENAGYALDTRLIADTTPTNSINLDHEVAGMADAELRYQTIAQAIQKKFGLMDMIIGGKNK